MSRQIIKSALTVFSIIVLLSSIMLVSGCEKSSTSDSSGSGSTSGDVVLGTPTASPSSLSSGGSSVVEVLVTDADDDPLSGVTVTFVASGGYFSPTSVVTGTDGLASSVYTATTTGTFSLVVQASGESESVQVTVSASGQQSSGNLDISVSPNLLTADGASSSTVTIAVADADDDPAPEGTVVLLTAGERFDDIDANGYFSEGVDSLVYDVNSNGTWDPIGIISSVAYTDATGEATATFTAGTSSGTSYIRATVTGTDGYDGYAQTSVTLQPDADVYAIELYSDEPSIQVAHTGGIEMTELHAACYDISGNAAPEGVDVNFIITASPDLTGIPDSCNINGIGYGPVTVQTNSSGIATIQMWSGVRSGTIRCYASATGSGGTALSEATFIAVHAGPPYYVSVGAYACNMQGWATVNETNEITAVVSDTFNNPVQEEVAVYFTVDECIIEAYSTTAEETGVAGTTFRTGDPWGDGIVWVYAETSGGTVKDSTYFINSHIPAYITMWNSPTSLEADGKAKAAFFVDVRDLNNNYVIDQTAIKVTTLYGTATQGSTSDGCHASIYEGEYTSGVLEKDHSVTGANDDGIGGVDYIKAISGFVSTSVPCTLTTEYAYTDNCNISVESNIPYNTNNVPVSVLIKDRYNNPLGDHTLTISISPAGSIVGGTATQETNAWGEAYGFRINAPAPPAPDIDGNIPDTKAIITIVDSDPRGQIELSASVTFSDE